MSDQPSETRTPYRLASVCRVLPTPDDPAFGIFVLNRLRAMAQRMPLEIIQPVPYAPGIRPLPVWGSQALHGNPPVHRVPMLYVPGMMKWLDARWLLRAVLPRLRVLRERGRLDVIDAHFGYPEGAAMIDAGRLLKVPVFVTLRGVESELFDDRRIGPKLRRSLQAADGCICVSEFLAERAVSNGVSPQRIEVIPNAIDRDRYRPGDRGTALRALGFAEDVRLMVSVGNLIDRKRHHVLLEAFARVAEHMPELNLAIIGSDRHDPAYADKLRTRVAELGLQGRIWLKGVVAPEQVPRWLQAGELFALVSSREGCCNALLEALACGLPAVATPVGDNASVVVEGRNGRLVPVDDAEATAHAICELLGRQWDAQALSQAFGVGGWSETAAQVEGFMRRQLSGSLTAGRALAMENISKEAME